MFHVCSDLFNSALFTINVQFRLSIYLQKIFNLMSVYNIKACFQLVAKNFILFEINLILREPSYEENMLKTLATL